MGLWACEPSLGEILSDPATRALMRADGVDPRALEAELKAVARSRKPSRARHVASAAAHRGSGVECTCF